MIEFSEADRMGVGQFADVFRMADRSRVCKIYRAAGSPKWREWAERIQQQELNAYQIAMSNRALEPHTARCFGTTSVARVLSDQGEDISALYLLRTAMVIEALAGDEEKAAGLDPAEFPHVYRLLHAFDQVGIEAGDASVFGFQSPSEVKFIDITTKYGARIVAEVL